MKIARVLLVLLLVGCQKAPETEVETDSTGHETIGPGSEPSILIPPDTPMTSREHAAPRDSTSRRDSIR